MSLDGTIIRASVTSISHSPVSSLYVALGADLVGLPVDCLVVDVLPPPRGVVRALLDAGASSSSSPLDRRARFLQSKTRVRYLWNTDCFGYSNFRFLHRVIQKYDIRLSDLYLCEFFHHYSFPVTAIIACFIEARSGYPNIKDLSWLLLSQLQPYSPNHPAIPSYRNLSHLTRPLLLVAVDDDAVDVDAAITSIIPFLYLLPFRLPIRANEVRVSPKYQVIGKLSPSIAFLNTLSEYNWILGISIAQLYHILNRFTQSMK